MCDVDKGYGVEDNLVLVIGDGSFGCWCVMLTKVMVMKVIWFWSLVMVVWVLMCDVDKSDGDEDNLVLVIGDVSFG